MGKNKTTKADGVENLADTQDLSTQKRFSKGALAQNVRKSRSSK